MKYPLVLLTALLTLTAATSSAQPVSPAGLVQGAQDSPERRESTVTLSFDAPGGTNLLVAHTLPPGGSYVLGSAALNNLPVADPRVGPSGQLYFTPDLPSGVLTYRVTHPGPLGVIATPALRANYGTLGAQDLQGVIDQTDWETAQTTGAVQAAENAGAIKIPLAGRVITGRDSTNVTVEQPIGSTGQLSVNGVTVSATRIGQRSTDSILGTERLTFIAVPLQEGVNTLAFGNQHLTVTRAGAATQVRGELLQGTADGVTPLTVRLTLLDTLGFPASDANVTLTSDPEPLGTDANTSAAGFQAALTGGAATVNLTPVTVPRPVTVQVLIGETLHPLTFTTQPSGRQVAIGVGSITAGVIPFGVWDTRGALTLETPALGGQLYVHADSQGPMQPVSADSWTTFGDASAGAPPLPSLNGVAVLYDRPEGQARYGLVGGVSTLAPVPAAQGVSVVGKGDFTVRGFAVGSSRDTRSVTLPATGSRQYRLPGAAVPGTAQMWVIARDEGGVEIHRDMLQPGLDYVFEEDGGLIFLARPLPLLNERLERQALLVTYRPVGGTDDVLAWGVEGQARFGSTQVNAGAVNDGRAATTFGVKVAVQEAAWNAEARALYAGGFNVYARASFTSVWTGGLSATYTGASYAGVDPLSPGLNASVNLNRKVTGPWGVQVNANVHNAQTFSARLATQATYTAAPWTFGAGAQVGFGEDAGIAALGSVGYTQGPVNVNVTQTLPVSGGSAETQLAAQWKVLPNVTLQANTALKDGRMATAFGVGTDLEEHESQRVVRDQRAKRRSGACELRGRDGLTTGRADQSRPARFSGYRNGRQRPSAGRRRVHPRAGRHRQWDAWDGRHREGR